MIDTINHSTVWKGKNRRQWWSREDTAKLIKLNKENKPMEEIAKLFNRSIEQCVNKLHKQGYSTARKS